MTLNIRGKFYCECTFIHNFQPIKSPNPYQRLEKVHNPISVDQNKGISHLDCHVGTCP